MKMVPKPTDQHLASLISCNRMCEFIGVLNSDNVIRIMMEGVLDIHLSIYL